MIGKSGTPAGKTTLVRKRNDDVRRFRGFLKFHGVILMCCFLFILDSHHMTNLNNAKPST